MMKSGVPVVIVDFVADAVKFYTEKLGFDIVEVQATTANHPMLSFAQVKKGKCHIIFRSPHGDEMLEFSQIKHCVGRGVGIFAELKKGVEKYFNRCKKKGVTIDEELHDTDWGYKAFVAKDPFGIRICFCEPLAGFSKPLTQFAGLSLDTTKSNDVLRDEMIKHLKMFGVTRRPAKKFANTWLRKLRK